jgi:hypothetical protein
MSEQDIDGDFTAIDTTLLNRYFREYYRQHGQGGTHTQTIRTSQEQAGSLATLVPATCTPRTSSPHGATPMPP